MVKERLCSSDAAKFVKGVYKHRIKAIFLMLVLAVNFFLMFLLMRSFELDTASKLLLCGALLVLVIIVLYYAGKFSVELYKARSMKQGEFRFVTDELQYAEVRTVVRYRHRHHVPEDTYYLVFKCYGEFRVYNKVYYQGTALEMGLTGVYNTAVQGDEFYLLLSPKQEILMVYNKKFFELEEEA